MNPYLYNPQAATIRLQGSSPSLQGSSPRVQGSTIPVVQSPNLPGNLIGLSGPIRQSGGSSGAAPAPAPSAPSNPTGGSARPDRSNSIAVQLAGLASLVEQEAAGLAAVDRALQELLGRYGREAERNERQYSTQSTTNKQNLQTNRQVAMSNAVQGRQGLFGTLASLGALSGSGIELANRAVQQGANADLTGAQGTFNENQTRLDTIIEQFRDEDEERKREAESAARDARSGVQAEIARSRQGFYSKLADDYAQMGNEAEARRYSQLVAEQYPLLARTSIPSLNLPERSAAFTPTDLSNYIAGGNTTVQVAPAQPGGLPGLMVSTAPRRRERERAVA